MAYLSDTAWCDPDLAELSLPAYAIWCKALSYSSGMSTRGHLTLAQQKLIGATPKIRGELVERGRWIVNGDQTSVVINKWDDYNGKRDERRLKDRQRKRAMRASAGQGADK